MPSKKTEPVKVDSKPSDVKPTDPKLKLSIVRKYKVKTADKRPSDALHFPVVGIGASAGGLEALELFFRNTPENTGMAFVVIQHLDPDHKGILPELLQRSTYMKVEKIAENMKIKPDHVYVIPPNKSLTVEHGCLRLFEPVETRGLRLPIDIFLRALAVDLQERSIGIILSGMGSDGSSGLKSIKEKGGLVVIQEPQSAKFDAMPKSALASVMADIIAPPEEMPYRIISYLKISPPVKVENLNDARIKNNIDKILYLIRHHTGHDFSNYKKSGIYRRIERRKGVHQITKIQDYVKFLHENPKEIDILFQELMVGVTNFFRDPALWDRLRDEILPTMLGDLNDGAALRAWVPGCSTGEEAYSWAIVFKETQEKLKKPKNITLQIFATDIDHYAIEKARKGVYSSNIAVDVSPERLNRFFNVDSEGFRVNASLREMIVFAEQNIVRDPPFTRLDILSCRNLFIYLEAEKQKKLISLFFYSLKPGGIFVLGNAETLVNHRDGFKEVDSRLKIYRRSSSMYSAYTELIDFPSNIQTSKSYDNNKKMPPKEPENIQNLADQHVIQNFSPATVLVNEKGDIVYITGRTGKYLEPTAGKANWNIYSMARPGLRHELPAAFRLALQSYEPIILPSVKVGTNGGQQYVEVTVQRIKNPASIRNMIIVVFRDLPPQLEGKKVVLSNKKSQKHQELEKELEKSYEDLQSTREEMQASQEELKSINEELQSTNEELQSTNEELTTSKEEMQSMNEELQTLNTELQSKVNDLVMANNDMKNLLNNTDIATLFLDKDLSIRRFTDPVTKIFKLRTADIGRPFTDLVTNLQYPELESHAKQVLKNLVTIENAAITKNGLWINVRIMPYRTEDDRIDGLVMTFTDITTVKKLETELKKANDELQKGKHE